MGPSTKIVFADHLISFSYAHAPCMVQIDTVYGRSSDRARRLKTLSVNPVVNGYHFRVRQG